VGLVGFGDEGERKGGVGPSVWLGFGVCRLFEGKETFFWSVSVYSSLVLVRRNEYRLYKTKRYMNKNNREDRIICMGGECILGVEMQ
jgi:hypothetical protein